MEDEPRETNVENEFLADAIAVVLLKGSLPREEILLKQPDGTEVKGLAFPDDSGKRTIVTDTFVMLNDPADGSSFILNRRTPKQI